MFTIRNRKTKATIEMTFATKLDAWKYLVENHGLTWDRRYSIVSK